MIGRIVRSTDFERVLRVRSRVSSAHFALHHLSDRPSKGASSAVVVLDQKLSTGGTDTATVPVDDLPPEALWLGAVVPKRHARRAVTRTLIKRQIRTAMARHAGHLAGGLWVVRLRSPFDRARFISASSDLLKQAARTELEQVLAAAAQRAAVP